MDDDAILYYANLGSLFDTSFPSLNHFTLASGLSTAHFSCTFLLVFPFFFNSSFFLNPYSGSGAKDYKILFSFKIKQLKQNLEWKKMKNNLRSTSRYALVERSLHSLTVQVYRPVSPVSGFLIISVKVSSSFSNPNLGPL